jgi:Fe-S cluster assembly iron-binding protein IscA
MALITEKTVRDEEFQDNGTKILVKKLDLPYLQGSEIDIVQNELSRAFKIFNPNQIESLGCGTCGGDAGCC